MKDVTDPELLPSLLKKVTYPSLEDLYAAIGYGGFSAQKAVSRMQGEILRVARQHQLEQQAAEAAETREEPKTPRRSASKASRASLWRAGQLPGKIF